MGMDGRTDFVVNVLLFMPSGFLGLGAWRVDHRGALADVFAGLAVIAGCAGLSMSIEFTELFFPGRTLSFNDMIAQTSGAVLGVMFWLVTGRALTAWIRGFGAEREPKAFVERLLVAYCAGFAVAQLLPLDLLTNLEEVARKYRQGRIVLAPFSYQYASSMAMVWDHLWDVLLNVPLGMAAAVVWLRPGMRRSAGNAFLLAASAVIALELGQVFVNTRIADVTDVLKGVAGAAIGVAAAMALVQGTLLPQARSSNTAAVIGRIGLVIWTLALAGYHLSPFEFEFSTAQFSRGVDQLLRLPLASYYWAQEFQAFTEFLRKSMLGLPLGVLFQLATPDSGRDFERRLRWVFGTALGAILLLAIELGQCFVPSRYPDITDVMIGTFGVGVGLWIAGRIRPAIEMRRATSASLHAC
jgi:glycopeptide antibiotics resistance protein